MYLQARAMSEGGMKYTYIYYIQMEGISKRNEKYLGKRTNIYKNEILENNMVPRKCLVIWPSRVILELIS